MHRSHSYLGNTAMQIANSSYISNQASLIAFSPQFAQYEAFGVRKR